MSFERMTFAEWQDMDKPDADYREPSVVWRDAQKHAFEETADEITRLTDLNTDLTSTYNAHMSSWAERERAKDAEIERLRDALEMIQCEADRDSDGRNSYEDRDFYYSIIRAIETIATEIMTGSDAPKSTQISEPIDEGPR